jgi:hypothetical protein
LQNFLAEDTPNDAEAASLVRYWNTGVADDNVTNSMLSNFTAPKYNFKDDKDKLISEPRSYAVYLDSWYY